MRNLVYNSVKCLGCGKILVSRYTHDYKSCKCDNHTFVDGGISYSRFGGQDLSLIKQRCVYDDDDFEIVRAHFCRGSRGVDGKEKLRWIPLMKMSVDYILAVKSYNIKKNIVEPQWMKDLYDKELERRIKVQAYCIWQEDENKTSEQCWSEAKQFLKIEEVHQ